MTNEEREALVNRVKTNIALINSDIDIASDQTIAIIETVIDRLLLYLNSETIPTLIERLIAEIVINGLNRIININGGNDTAISSVSDNGQSISYSNEAKKYFVTSSDDEVFSGYVGVLNRYRRLKVVHN